MGAYSHLATRFNRHLVIVALVGLAVAALLVTVGVVRPALATHPGTTVLVDGTDATSDVGGCGSVANPCDTIQAAIDHANAGDTIDVAAGTYDEALDIDGHSGLTIDGGDNTTVTLAPTTTLGWNVGGYGASRQTAIRVVDSTDVALQNMTMDFDAIKANFVFGVLYWDSTGEINDNVLENLSIDDLSGGYYEFGAYLRAPGYTDGARASITASGNTFVDAGRVAINIHDYVDATVSGNTFYKTLDDFGYAIELGSASTGAITGNTIYGYDTPAASDGSTSAGIYVENAFTGGFFPLITGVTKDVLISGNEVYDSQWCFPN